MDKIDERVFEGRTFADPETGCIEWTGGRVSKGYGQVEVGGRRWFAHRLAWTVYRGAIPKGLYVLHRCDNPPCCNPEHLFLGTHADNMADMARKGRASKMGAPLWAVRKPRKRKLSDADVRLIRQSPLPSKDLEWLLEITHSTVSDIRNRKRKKGVPDDGPVTDATELLRSKYVATPGALAAVRGDA